MGFGGYSGGYCGGYGGGFAGGFALLVVLFILLIIIGASGFANVKGAGNDNVSCSFSLIPIGWIIVHIASEHFFLLSLHSVWIAVSVL